ncbi:hypothetical protein PV797_15915 [Clostridiaceae bacterium M8S5]|nr:hypothetical protein PV797_15915 [Clostridiaceae bacterium M8S5]
MNNTKKSTITKPKINHIIIALTYIGLIIAINQINSTIYNDVINTFDFLIICLLLSLSEIKDIYHRRTLMKKILFIHVLMFIAIITVYIMILPAYTHDEAIDIVKNDFKNKYDLDIVYEQSALERVYGRYFVKFKYVLYFKDRYKKVIICFNPLTGDYEADN